MMTNDYELPPNPITPMFAVLIDKASGTGTAETVWQLMQEFARQAIEADRKQRHLKERAQLNQEWAALKGMQAQYEAERKRRGEPICNLWINPETLEYEVDRCTHPLDELIPVHKAPAVKDPSTITEPVKCDGNHGGPRCADPECWNDSPAEPVKAPSDVDILEIWQEFRDYHPDWICKFAYALLDRYGQPCPHCTPVDGKHGPAVQSAWHAGWEAGRAATQAGLPQEKPDPHYEEGATDVVTHAQRQSYADGWNDYRKEALKEPGV